MEGGGDVFTGDNKEGNKDIIALWLTGKASTILNLNP